MVKAFRLYKLYGANFNRLKDALDEHMGIYSDALNEHAQVSIKKVSEVTQLSRQELEKGMYRMF